MKTRHLPLILLLSVFIQACVPSVAIRFNVPGPINLGATDTITIVQTEGRRSAQEQVVVDLMSTLRSGGYYQVKDRSEEGIEVNVAGQTASVTGDTQGSLSNEMYMRIDVLEWDYDQNQNVKQVKDKDGNTVTKTVIVSSGEVVLAVTICPPKGGPTVIAEREYVGKFTTEKEGFSEATVMQKASQNVVNQLVNDISPRTKQEHVRIDDSDPNQEGVIAAIEDGQYAQAQQWLIDYTNQNPQRASAWYNLALVTDAMGDYQTALTYYDKAIGLGGLDFYIEARAGCAKRLSQSEALSTQY